MDLQPGKARRQWNAGQKPLKPERHLLVAQLLALILHRQQAEMPTFDLDQAMPFDEISGLPIRHHMQTLGLLQLALTLIGQNGTVAKAAVAKMIVEDQKTAWCQQGCQFRHGLVAQRRLGVGEKTKGRDQVETLAIEHVGTRDIRTDQPAFLKITLGHFQHGRSDIDAHRFSHILFEQLQNPPGTAGKVEQPHVLGLGEMPDQKRAQDMFFDPPQKGAVG